MTRKGLSFYEFVYVWYKHQSLSFPKHHARISLFLEKCYRQRHSGLLLSFRNSGKSTLLGLFCAWLLLQDSSFRILIMAADFDLAKKMVRHVKRVIERHPLTLHLKPKKKDQWASDRFTVVRLSELRDPSVMAKGLSSNITGSRADLIVCDDVEVPKTADTAAKREDLRLKLSELDFVLVPGGFQLYVGTPHAEETLYQTGEGGFLKDFSELRIPIYDDKHQSVWPERFSEERIQQIEKRSGKRLFLSQMLLQPVRLSDSRLPAHRLKFYTDLPSDLSSVSCYWDPSSGVQVGDNSVIALVFRKDVCFYLHRAFYLPSQKEADAEGQCRQILCFLRENGVRQIVVESNGVGKFLPLVLKRLIRQENLRVQVIERHTRQNKDEKILSALEVLLEQGRLYAHTSVKDAFFMRELDEWLPGGNGFDDGLDAVSSAILEKGFSLSSSASPPVPVVAEFEFKV